jgi:site-specific recombinase XerC
LPSEEREIYVHARRQSGINEIAVRCTERYIDEFLRFCQQQFSHSDVQQVTAAQIKAFAVQQCRQGLLDNTIRMKLRDVMNWCDWLEENGRVTENAAKGLQVSALLAEAKEATRTPR